MSTSHVMNTYARLPVAFTHGRGVLLWDKAGREYLDGLAGIAVSGLGHAHPKLVKAISEQAGRLIHTSNIYQVPEQEKLADKICALSGMDEVFFCNSGAEANEAAIKLAILYGYKKTGQPGTKIVVMERAWHGRTIGTLAATGSEKARKGFEPLPDNSFVRVPYSDMAAIEAAANQHPEIQAVLLEVLQGEGGINIASNEYLQQLRAFCTARGWLLMIDEVQSGIGRTGTWFGYQHAGIQPDVITLAKGLGSGVPIGACVATGPAAGVMQPGNHGTTFGGGPLVSTAALATLNIMEEEGLLANAAKMGGYLRAGLENQLLGLPGVVEVRGRGLMIGIELTKPCGELVKQALEIGLLINVTRENVVRLLPPLVLSTAEADLLLTRLVPLIKAFVA